MTVDGEVFQTGTRESPAHQQRDAARRALQPIVRCRSSPRATRTSPLVTGPATFSATLEWGIVVTTSPGRGSFVLPVPPAGSATATFDVPGEQSDLRVSPGLVLRRTSAGGRTIVEATLDPGSPTQVWWSSRDTGPAAPRRATRGCSPTSKPSSPSATPTCGCSRSSTSPSCRASPTEFEVRIPAGYELAGVTGSSLERSEQQGERVRPLRLGASDGGGISSCSTSSVRARADRSRSRPASRRCPPRSAKPAKSRSRASARSRFPSADVPDSAGWTCAKSTRR